MIGPVSTNKNGLMSSSDFFRKMAGKTHVNDLKSSGIYANVEGTATYYGIVVVFEQFGYLAQFFLASDGAFYFRTYGTSSWNSWARIDR